MKRAGQYRMVGTLFTLFLLSLLTRATIAQTSVSNTEEWERLRNNWLKQLREEAFKGWPGDDTPLEATTVFDASHKGVALRAIDFTSEEGVQLRLFVSHYPGLEKPDLVVLNLMDEEGWSEFLATMRVGFEKELAADDLPEADEASFKQMKGMYRSFKWAMAYIAPRGIGALNKDADGPEKAKLESADLVWDMRRSIQALRSAGGLKKTPLWLQSHGEMANAMLVASLFEPDVVRLDLYELPKEPALDLPADSAPIKMSEILAMAIERSRVILYEKTKNDWSYVNKLSATLKWDNDLQVRTPPSDDG